MNFYAVFLRGVNVGGVKILMKDLTALLEGAGFLQVRTLLASGNVVLASTMTDPAAVKQACEDAIAAAYDYGTRVIVQNLSQLEHLAGNYPFTAPQDGIQRHEYLVLCESKDAAAEILASAPDPGDGERIAALGQGICWEVPRGDSLGTPLAKHFTKSASAYLVTTRNLNTVNKMLAALRTLG